MAGLALLPHVAEGPKPQRPGPSGPLQRALKSQRAPKKSPKAHQQDPMVVDCQGLVKATRRDWCRSYVRVSKIQEPESGPQFSRAPIIGIPIKGPQLLETPIRKPCTPFL